VNAIEISEEINEADVAAARFSIGRRFAGFYRERRRYSVGDYHPSLLLSLWCTWEKVRDSFARSVADDVVKGFGACLPIDAAGYRIACERHDAARDRYLAHERANLETAGPARVQS
jgi:hypothetical protein